MNTKNKPNYYINGYPAYKEYYLKSENFPWEDFIDEVDQYIDNKDILSDSHKKSRFMERESEVDLDYYIPIIGIAAVEDLKYRIRQFEALISDGVIGVVQ